MSSVAARWIRSRENALLRRCRRLVREPSAYRELGQLWLEGEHLCRALLARGGRPESALIAESAWQASGPLSALASEAEQVLVVPDALFIPLSALPSPAGLAFLVRWMPPGPPKADEGAVLLDRVQDAGNVGSILRSASALGVHQVWALPGTASLWSPKVMRSAMGAHFGLTLIEGITLQDLPRGHVVWIAADANAGAPLGQSLLPDPCVWVFGHEGRGIAAEVATCCEQRVRIPQPGGEDSLNVAAAAAICLYESARQRRRGGGPSGPSDGSAQ